MPELPASEPEPEIERLVAEEILKEPLVLARDPELASDGVLTVSAPWVERLEP